MATKGLALLVEVIKLYHQALVGAIYQHSGISSILGTRLWPQAGMEPHRAQLRAWAWLTHCTSTPAHTA